MTWDGKERRGNEDHDLLTRIDENVSSLKINFTKHIEKFDKHVEDDNEKFESIKRYVWMAIGAMMVIELGLRFVNK